MVNFLVNASTQATDPDKAEYWLRRVQQGGLRPESNILEGHGLATVPTRECRSRWQRGWGSR